MFKLDSEIAAALAAFAPASGLEQPSLDDLPGLRAFTDLGLRALFAQLPDAPLVRTTKFHAPAADGHRIDLTWYEPEGASSQAAVVYVHGGGMIGGSPDVYDRLLRTYVAMSGVRFLAVAYRLAPEYRDVGLAKDVLVSIRWLKAEAGSLGIDPDRIAVMGDSGGGGVGAAAVIMARDGGVGLSRQILIFPMLDDTNIVPDPWLAPTATWSYEKNRAAWNAVLGPDCDRDSVSPTLAPARLDAFGGLPPAYIEVGEMDIFRDESIAFAQGLFAAGISCELWVVPGSPHAHELLDVNSAISQRAFAARVRVLKSL